MLRLVPPVTLLAFALLATACSHADRAPDFTLRDDGGRSWTLSQQRGEALLLTFGFTHCADTCPATLAKLERLTQTLGKRSLDVEIAMVTIDPQRDTSPTMHRFIARFARPGGSRLVGLTGTAGQIQAVERSYHIWSQRIPGQHGADDYDEAHTAVIYLIDARGRIRGLDDDDDPASSIAAALRQILG
jgi:protein SCO1